MALVVAMLPSLPEFLEEVKVLKVGIVPKSLADLYHYAWFVGFTVAFVVYLAGRKLTSESQPITGV